MGACFNTATFNSKTIKELLKCWYAMLEELRYEYGHNPYSGTFATCAGIVVKDTLFKTRSEAEEWLVHNTSKWGNAVAVRVFVPNKAFKDTAKYKAIENELAVVNEALAEDYKAASGYMTWDLCNRNKLQEQKEKLHNKIAIERVKYIDKEFSKVTKREKKFVYFVGGWCAE